MYVHRYTRSGDERMNSFGEMVVVGTVRTDSPPPIEISQSKRMGWRNISGGHAQQHPQHQHQHQHRSQPSLDGSVGRKEGEVWVRGLDEWGAVCEGVVGNFGKKLGVGEGFAGKKNTGVCTCFF